MNHCLNKLEQLERLRRRSEDTPRRLMITHTFFNFETDITRDTPS